MRYFDLASADLTYRLSYDTLFFNYRQNTNGNALSSIRLNNALSGNSLYDLNDNLLREGNTGYDISYNILNYPDKFSKGSENTFYIYSASGEKFAMQVGSSLTYYRGFVVYTGNAVSYFEENDTCKLTLNNVSTNAISSYASGISRWDLLFNSCVGHTSRALWSAGIPNMLAVHPHILNFQLFIRQLGIYTSPYLYQIPKH